MRKLLLHRIPMRHFTGEQRVILERLWNVNVNKGHDTRLTIRGFAGEHAVPYPTLRRELERGMPGKVFFDKLKGEWFYPEYSAAKAQADTVDKNARKGAPMRFTATLAKAFRHHIPGLKKSPAHARHDIAAEGHARVPCVSSVYYHIDHGDIGVLRGQTPYRPSAERKCKRPARRSRKGAANLSIEDRPPEANGRAEPGHWEMDSVVSCASDRGRLLVLAERVTRFMFSVRLKSLTAKAVRSALRGLIRSGRLKRVRSIATDNGCEFLDSASIGRLFRDINATLKIYYTHAYAAWEKGTAENINRHIRRFFPKGTDFRHVSERDIMDMQNFINAIPRTHTLKGKTAHEAFYATA
jgi:IS30 family transposase